MVKEQGYGNNGAKSVALFTPPFTLDPAGARTALDLLES